MISWIYESPDNGKTLYRRVIGKHEAGGDDRQLMVDNDVWFNVAELKKLGREAYQQQCMRLEHPALNQLWEEYHFMLNLIRNQD